MSNEISLEPIREFILSRLNSNPPGLLVDEVDDLVELGLLDSHGLVQLVDYLERTFEVRVPLRGLTRANFGSLKRIATYLNQLRNSC